MKYALESKPIKQDKKYLIKQGKNNSYEIYIKENNRISRKITGYEACLRKARTHFPGLL
jgi:hypothetical protein